MDDAEWIGWFSSVILIATLGRQVLKQWRSGEVAGVSRWLFVGQTAASTGFTIYSVLLSNWVFTVTNSLLLVNAIAGYWVSARNRRLLAVRQPRPSAAGAPSLPGTSLRARPHLADR